RQTRSKRDWSSDVCSSDLSEDTDQVDHFTRGSGKVRGLAHLYVGVVQPLRGPVVLRPGDGRRQGLEVAVHLTRFSTLAEGQLEGDRKSGVQGSGERTVCSK